MRLQLAAGASPKRVPAEAAPVPSPAHCAARAANGRSAFGATAAPAPAPAPAPATSTGTDPLVSLRSHPQLDALRQLTQTNPASLPSLLQTIGAQDPRLLTAINENREPTLDEEDSSLDNNPAAYLTPMLNKSIRILWGAMLLISTRHYIRFI